MSCSKRLLLVIMVNFLLVLSGCGSDGDNDIDIIEKFVGSGGPGDFYSITLNMTDKKYSYENLTTGSDSGNGSFDSISASGNSGVFRLDTDDLLIKLEDEIVVVADSSNDLGERITVALEKPDNSYGNNITGRYNLATSMEGWIGEVNIDGSKQEADIYLDGNNDGDYEDIEERLLNLPYSFNDTFNAIELIESNEFKHYGVYIDNDFAVWDSYYWNGSEWQGDGMAVMVRQPDAVNLLDLVGRYTFIDVDGYNGTYQLTDISDGETKLELNIVNEDHDEIIITNNNVRSTGIIDFSADLVEPFGTPEDWHIMVLPGKAMVIASSDDNAFDGEGGIAVAIKEQ